MIDWFLENAGKIDDGIWAFVELAISFALGWFILSLFLPLNEIVYGLFKILTRRKTKIIEKKKVVLKCSNCGTNNSKQSQFCTQCGQKLN